MSVVRPPLSAEHRHQLRCFVRLVDDMGRSRFIERYRRQDHKVSCKPGEDGNYRVTHPEYDWEDFKSFLTMFRQVGVSKREPVYFPKVLKTVGRYASDDLRRQLTLLRNDLVPLLQGRYRCMMLGREVGGREQKLSVPEAFDALVNGKVFHSDPGHREAVEFLDATEPWFFIWPLMTEFIHPCMRGFIWLFKALRRDGVLEDADYPAHCVLSKAAEPTASRPTGDFV